MKSVVNCLSFVKWRNRLIGSNSLTELKLQDKGVLPKHLDEATEFFNKLKAVDTDLTVLYEIATINKMEELTKVFAGGSDLFNTILSKASDLDLVVDTMFSHDTAERIKQLFNSIFIFKSDVEALGKDIGHKIVIDDNEEIPLVRIVVTISNILVENIDSVTHLRWLIYYYFMLAKLDKVTTEEFIARRDFIADTVFRSYCVYNNNIVDPSSLVIPLIHFALSKTTAEELRNAYGQNDVEKVVNIVLDKHASRY